MNAIKLKLGMDLEMGYHKFLGKNLAFSEHQTMLDRLNIDSLGEVSLIILILLVALIVNR